MMFHPIKSAPASVHSWARYRVATPLVAGDLSATCQPEMSRLLRNRIHIFTIFPPFFVYIQEGATGIHNELYASIKTSIIMNMVQGVGRAKYNQAQWQ